MEDLQDKYIFIFMLY